MQLPALAVFGNGWLYLRRQNADQLEKYPIFISPICLAFCHFLSTRHAWNLISLTPGKVLFAQCYTCKNDKEGIRQKLFQLLPSSLKRDED
jgi:hypothetical protein